MMFGKRGTMTDDSAKSPFVACNGSFGSFGPDRERSAWRYSDDT